MADQHVKVSVEERVAVLLIDRPPVNALNAQMLNDLGAAFDEVSASPEVKVIVITGAGQKAFVAGADIGGFQTMTRAEGTEFSLKGQALFNKIEASRKPVIAALNGVALGGGCELAMACHIRIAEWDAERQKGARLGQPEINLGIFPGWGGTQRLPRLVGRGKALEFMLTGDMISALEAHRLGLVNRLAGPGQALEEAKKLATQIASKGALAIAACLETVEVGLNRGLEEGLRLEAGKFGAMFETEDMHEGVRAFLEKRPPQFKDR